MADHHFRMHQEKYGMEYWPITPHHDMCLDEIWDIPKADVQWTIWSKFMTPRRYKPSIQTYLFLLLS